MTDQELQIATGIRTINTRHFDYLYDLKEVMSSVDVPSVTRFMTEVTERGAVTVIFVAQKGVALRSDIKREIIELYNTVYEIVD